MKDGDSGERRHIKYERIKVETSEEVADGAVKKAYHHGRCDVGSPFATGKLFDAEESDCG